MKKEINCKNCRYWFVKDRSQLLVKPRLAVEGSCRRYAPSGDAIWNATTEDYWCGEFKPLIGRRKQ